MLNLRAVENDLAEALSMARAKERDDSGIREAIVGQIKYYEPRSPLATYEMGRTTPSWTVLLVEIGKLIAARVASIDEANRAADIDRMENESRALRLKVDELESRLSGVATYTR